MGEKRQEVVVLIRGVLYLYETLLLTKTFIYAAAVALGIMESMTYHTEVPKLTTKWQSKQKESGPKSEIFLIQVTKSKEIIIVTNNYHNNHNSSESDQNPLEILKTYIKWSS